jgi:hypothetical protein
VRAGVGVGDSAGTASGVVGAGVGGSAASMSSLRISFNTCSQSASGLPRGTASCQLGPASSALTVNPAPEVARPQASSPSSWSAAEAD